MGSILFSAKPSHIYTTKKFGPVWAFFMILRVFSLSFNEPMKRFRNKNITSITRFFGGLPRFLLNIASILVVIVIEIGSMPCRWLMFHFLEYSWIL